MKPTFEISELRDCPSLTYTDPVILPSQPGEQVAVDPQTMYLNGSPSNKWDN